MILPDCGIAATYVELLRMNWLTPEFSPPTTSSSFSGEYTVNRIQKEFTASDENGNAERKTRRTVSIIAFGKPYLSLVEGSAKIEDIIAEDMKRKRPEREPLFPPHGLLDFDWSVFDERFKAMFDRMNP